jgi:hypothetical protein
MTPMPSFEFCAFRFLSQWEESEYALYNAIRSTPTEKDIRKALSYFQVARNFEGLKEAANAAFIVQSLLEVRADQTLPSPHEKVHQLVKTLETRFKQNNLSLRTPACHAGGRAGSSPVAPPFSSPLGRCRFEAHSSDVPQHNTIQQFGFLVAKLSTLNRES